MGEAFQPERQPEIWHPHWKRVEAEDAEMKISEWVSRKRKLRWCAHGEYSECPASTLVPRPDY
jgi:hypothetical protein